MDWCRPGDKPISEAMMVRLPSLKLDELSTVTDDGQNVVSNRNIYLHYAEVLFDSWSNKSINDKGILTE